MNAPNINTVSMLSDKLKNIDKKLILNSALFQANWFLCLMAPAPIYLIGTALLVFIHFATLPKHSSGQTQLCEYFWFLAILVVGFVVELIHFNFGLLYFIKPELHFALNIAAFSNPIFLPPVWLLCLWISFASLLRVSLLYFLKQPLFIATLCALFTPLSYLSGAYLNDAVSLADPAWLSLVGVGALWFVAMYICSLIYRKYMIKSVDQRQGAE